VLDRWRYRLAVHGFSDPAVVWRKLTRCNDEPPSNT
jgi:hypothetical protein